MYALSSTLDPIHREADVDAARFDTVVTDLLDGQYADPLRVITSQPVSRDLKAAGHRLKIRLVLLDSSSS
jgi:hypothetical protein